ncbi:serine/threonine-protein kinase [Anthocerotibacter panamensis]|uniref:serine/threonine-protein kinase n=1 Tax=Anthocerotibacter panamensis TaxID=2857077 RepID=UPI001C40521D|nr:serine/threonine-protein kinase [Anthocerotibacter panamensis]
MDSSTSTEIGALDQPIGGRYQLLAYINGGGMGRVYQARDTRLANKVVAIKVLALALGGSPESLAQMRQRFEQEAQLSALLGGHPRIIQVTDYGVEQSQPYLVMEYLQGRTLNEVIQQESPLEPERVVRLALQICEGLHYAHTLQTTLGERTITGVIHRDVKASNFFLLDEGTLGETVKILDFGIAKAISEVSVALGTNINFVGSWLCASPEQMRGEILDPRSDIYSLGIVLYEMLTGLVPFQPETNTLTGWYQTHNFIPATPIDQLTLTRPVPPALAAVVMSCLAKDREDRPLDMKTLGEQLTQALQPRRLPPPSAPDAIPALTPLPSPAPDAILTVLPLPKVPASRKGLVVGAALLLTVLLGVLWPFVLSRVLSRAIPTVLPSDAVPDTTPNRTQPPQSAPVQPGQPLPPPPIKPRTAPAAAKRQSSPQPKAAARQTTPREQPRQARRRDSTSGRRTAPGQLFRANPRTLAPDCYDPRLKLTDFRCRNRKN